MQTVLIVFHLMVVVALVITVLWQRSEGGALGMGGGGGFMTGRSQANALTRATAILATIFFVTSVGLSLLAGYNRAPKSILDSVRPASQGPIGGPTAPGGNLLDQLKTLENQRGTTPPAPTPPAAPEAPRSQ